jgi:signal transduction histidine kinase/ActR/RegA family two-component response regulator
VSTIRFGDDRLDVEIDPCAAIGLIECDLQFATNIVVVKLRVLTLRDEDVELLRLIVADRNRPAELSGERLSHFVGEARGHAFIIDDLPSFCSKHAFGGYCWDRPAIMLMVDRSQARDGDFRMGDILTGLFDTSGFPARWQCGVWSDELGWLHIGSDLAIWGAYTAIPCVLAFFILRRQDIPFPRILWLFVAFIFACGTTHLISAIIFWHPVYRLDGVVKFFTAVVSWGTVIALVQIAPKALHLPGLAKLNAQLAHEIAERKHAEEERERLLDSERYARGEAERANRLKDEFLSLVSHELRTPLNAMLGYAQLLLMNQRSPEQITEAATVIERNGRAQVQIIDDLLDMSRVITGKMRLDVQPVDLCDPIRAAVSAVTPTASAREIEVTTVLDPRAGQVMGDASRLEQVFWNLLSNAIKFTPKGGKVQVSLARVDSHVEIRVADNGQGMPADLLPYIFDRFRQGDASTQRRHGGLGLGLSLVKHLVEMHGGSVTAQSDGAGQGSAFVVNLPMQIRTPDEDREGDRVHPSTEASRTRGLQPLPISDLRVLIVDDEADARGLIERMLGQHGVEIHLAHSADEALALLPTVRPDVIVSDIGMPGTDGYQFMRKVRSLSDEQGGRTPAVAVTAFARSEDRTKALLAGYQAHLAKPVDANELAAAVATLAGRTGRSL